MSVETQNKFSSSSSGKQHPNADSFLTVWKRRTKQIFMCLDALA